MTGFDSATKIASKADRDSRPDILKPQGYKEPKDESFNFGRSDMNQEELGADMYRLALLFERWNTNNRINELYHRWRLTVMKTQEVSSLLVIVHRRL